jgi:hypothetical protein
MMKRIWTVTAAAALVTAFCLAGAASAQAPLGLSIDPTEGFPGDVVDAMVDTGDIAANCPADSGPFLAGVTDILFFLVAQDPNDGEDPEGLAFCEEFFPDGCLATPNGFMNYDQVGYFAFGQTLLGIFADIPSGSQQDAFEQSFALVFANLAQEIQGSPSTFDRTTGLGSLMVPDVDPGLWAVAAACVLPTLDRLDLDPLREAIHGTGLILEAGGFPLEFPDPFDPDTQAFYAAHAPEFLQPVLVPQALGVQLFTVLAHLGHFQCYRAHPTVGVGAGTAGSLIPESLPVTLEDQFGVYSGTAHRPVDLCAPADKNGEDPEAPDSGDFLSSYKLSVPGPVEHVSGVTAVNQFGTITLDLLQPDTLLVPSAASLEGPPAPGQSFLNDFTCYSVQVGKTKGKGAPAPGSVMVQTAFETVEVEPGNPQRLCVPASKNGGPVIASAPEDLLCYDVKSGNDLKPAPEVFVANQFGQEVQRIGQRRELCVPTDLTE